MSKKVGVVRFLGTNCDQDVWQAVETVGLTPEWLWYEDQFEVAKYTALVVPGGFSYGDYLRCGALAAKSPVMASVKEAAEKGLPILGICNGFQILCETQLLPGTLMRNKNLKFIDQWNGLVWKSGKGPWSLGSKESSIQLPIAHGEGCFFVGDQEQKALWDNDQVWMTYSDNPNGSVGDIAGVVNKAGNVAGLMPHPERAMFEWMGGAGGHRFFETLLN